MLLHELGEDRVLGLEPLLQVPDAPLGMDGRAIGLAIRPFQGGGAVLKELFQPAVEDRGLELGLVADRRDRDLVDEVALEQGNLLLGRVMLSFPCHRGVLLPLSYRRDTPFPAEALQVVGEDRRVDRIVGLEGVRAEAAMLRCCAHSLTACWKFSAPARCCSVTCCDSVPSRVATRERARMRESFNSVFRARGDEPRADSRMKQAAGRPALRARSTTIRNSSWLNRMSLVHSRRAMPLKRLVDSTFMIRESPLARLAFPESSPFVDTSLSNGSF
jgi:hypothetical protein